MIRVSVILPTYNPNRNRLKQTLDGLKNQSLPIEEWELILIDNNSDDFLADELDFSWHPSAKVLREQKSGLTFARLCGFDAAKGENIVMVDDDNILSSTYLSYIKSIFQNDSELGAIGGKSLPLFEVPPPAWLGEYYGSLALRDLGNEILTANWNGQDYPSIAPIGAGMAIRNSALQSYQHKAKKGTVLLEDRKREQLSSGGDNEIILEILKSGWRIGYYPQLSLQHIIPPKRMTNAYVAKLVHDTNHSWVKLLDKYDINPWSRIHKFTLPFRKLKAYFRYSAWRGNQYYIRWRAACGLFDGLAETKNVTANN